MGLLRRPERQHQLAGSARPAVPAVCCGRQRVAEEGQIRSARHGLLQVDGPSPAKCGDDLFEDRQAGISGTGATAGHRSTARAAAGEVREDDRVQRQTLRSGGAAAPSAPARHGSSWPARPGTKRSRAPGELLIGAQRKGYAAPAPRRVAETATPVEPWMRSGAGDPRREAAGALRIPWVGRQMRR